MKKINKLKKGQLIEIPEMVLNNQLLKKEDSEKYRKLIKDWLQKNVPNSTFDYIKIKNGEKTYTNKLCIVIANLNPGITLSAENELIKYLEKNINIPLYKDPENTNIYGENKKIILTWKGQKIILENGNFHIKLNTDFIEGE